MKTWKVFVTAAVLMITAGSVMAQDKKGEAPAGMPPMGPPDEMKMCAGLVGNWDCAMKMHMSMDPKDTTWMEGKATAAYRYVLDGAALEMTFEQSMMGQKFSGFGLQTYDRETKQWQMTWTDNMSARTGLYTGTMDKTSATFSGEDRMMGQVVTSRISISNKGADSFDWKGEYSMDGGKTWMVWATAKYTKKK